MNISNFLKAAFLCSASLFVVSCDKDFNEIGSDIVGEDHFGFLNKDDFSIVANNFATGPVQSNNLEVNPLGIYDDPTFGKTTANFVTQVELAVENPTFTTINQEPVIDSVVLAIPYFSTRGISTTESTAYELDSIYGPDQSKMKLEIFRSGYYLRDIDHDADGEQQIQRYYTDQNSDIAATVIGGPLNTSAMTSENNQFYFSPFEQRIVSLNDDDQEETDKLAPGMRIHLHIDTFKQLILNAPAGSLESNNVFKNYFRGLYFKVSGVSENEGQLAMLNFKAGKITMNYKEDKNVTTTTAGVSTTVVERVEKALVMNLTGNTVSLIENENALPIPAISPEGTDKIYLKGGQGAVATIDIFGADDPSDDDNIPEELEIARDENWLINEANLTFYIDTEIAGAEPDRIYLYDINNKRPIIDYYFDNTTRNKPKYSKYIHNGVIEKENVDGGRGIRYKIRLTNYVKNLIQQDSTNVRLGLSITEAISNISMSKLRTPNAELNDFVPSASVMSPLGTIIYGTHPTVPEEKRLKMQIYYTKPN